MSAATPKTARKTGSSARTTPTKRPAARTATPRPTVSRPAVYTAITGTVVLALGAFVLSFASLTDLAVRAGISATMAWIWPLIVDGLIVVATVAIVALAGHGRRALTYPWALLIGGAGVSIAANAMHAVLASDRSIPVVISALVASVPPVVLLAVTHLAVILIQRSAPARARMSKARAAAAAREVDEATSQPKPTRPRPAKGRKTAPAASEQAQTSGTPVEAEPVTPVPVPPAPQAVAEDVIAPPADPVKDVEPESAPAVDEAREASLGDFEPGDIADDELAQRTSDALVASGVRG